MNKVKYIFRSFVGLIKERRLFVLAPILFILASLAFLVYFIGPAAIISFFYAGL